MKKKSKNIFFIIWQKKLKKKLSTYYMSPVILQKNIKKTSNENNVSEKQLKLTHAIKKQMKWEIILLKNSFFLFKFFALYESHIFLF